MKLTRFIFLFTLMMNSMSAITAQIIPNEQPLTFNANRKINVAFFIFDQVEALDLNGPVDILAKANRFGERYNLYTVSLTKSSVKSEGDVLTMTASYSIDDAPQADILIVPGSSPDHVIRMCTEHPELINWLKKQNEATQVTMSVCTGAFFLSAAGLLDGKQATAHGMSLDLLRRNPKIHVVENLRYVQDGKILTTAGITSGMDGTLHLVDLINGKKVADQIARILIYNRNGDMSFMKTETPK